MSDKSGSDDFEGENGKVSRSPTRSRSQSPASRPTQTRRVIIANIPYDVSWQELREMFRDRLGFTGYLQMYKSNGRPNGMASMEFRTIEGADRAIKIMNRFVLNGRKLVVREECARDKERLSLMEVDNDAPNMSSRPPIIDDRNVRRGHMERPGMADDHDGYLSDTVYISNLEFSVSAAKLRSVMKAAGEVVNVKLKTDNEGNPRGVAVVSFSHPYEATLAVKMFNGQTLKDRIMRVRIYRPENAAGGLPVGGSRGGFGRSYPDQPRYPRVPPSAVNLPNAPGTTQTAAAAAATLSLLLSGSPEAAAFGQLLSGGVGAGAGGVTDLLRVLAAGGGADGSMDGGRGPRGDSRYGGADSYGRVGRGGMPPIPPPSNAVMQQLMAAAMAGGMPYNQISSALTTLGFDNPHQDSMMARLMAGGDHDVGSDRRRGDTYYAASRDRSRSRMLPSSHQSGPPPILAGRSKPGFPPPGSRRRDDDRVVPRDPGRMISDSRSGSAQVEVVVKNLPYSYAWQDVKRIFRETGDVHYCNMPLDAEGKSQGVAYIGYSTAEECEHAVDRFNGSIFDGRRIKVQVAA